MTLPALAPYLTVVDAAAAIAFYRQAFGASETGPRLTGSDGGIMHTELTIGAGTLMLAEHVPDFGTFEPRSLGGTPVRLALHVDDAAAVVAQAQAAGATVVIPVEDQFYGHRAGRIKDPFGHVWVISQVIEELSADEMQRRMDALFSA
ncbi:MAG: VOC family protein [Gammaproteobacteria bacterium]|nr:VOC family protein [Gammaproteobacteria bacterium]NNM00825.1 VOC family protein [Gammaproteobacteria bacterium]